MDQNRVENQVDEGTLQIHLTNASTGIPVKGARITISYTGGPQQVLEEVDTDDSGNTEKITLDAPPLEYSMEPGENQPYAEYTIKVQATGYRDITVSAINILSGEDATQEVVMEAQDAPGDPIDTIVIDAHTLYGEYPPKIPESEIKTVEETGNLAIPVHLQDAHYKGSAKLGHGVGYLYAHDYPNHYVRQQYLPDAYVNEKFYEPGDMGYERDIKKHLDKIKSEA
mgnify:CR=1 FL=1